MSPFYRKGHAAYLLGEFSSDGWPHYFLVAIAVKTPLAILALAFGQRHAILDGNVKRVLARHRAISGWPGKAAVDKALWQAAEANTPASRVGDYTQAIMDLGATVCKRSKPLCERCPVRSDCIALAENTVSEYPGRKPKKSRPLKSTTMVLAVSNGAVYLERRPPSGIWGGLWSLPELDDDGVADWCRERLDTAGADDGTAGVLIEDKAGKSGPVLDVAAAGEGGFFGFDKGRRKRGFCGPYRQRQINDR